MPKLGSSDILVFAGDMLNMASHGYIPSAVHRVTTCCQHLRNISRFSFPVFIHPKRNVELSSGVTAMQALRDRITEIGFNGELLEY